MPCVSIIVPVYNVENYLRQCIDSIVHQTLKDIEIICVNDGSTDNSLKILEEYRKKDNRIKIISQENKGLSAARNAGIKIAQGEYIGFVDSDDWVDKDFFEKLYNLAIFKKADIVAANIIKEKTTKHHSLTNYFINKTTSDINKKFEYLKIPKFNYVWNKIYKREKLLKYNILFIEGIKYEDVDFTHKIAFYLDRLTLQPKTNYHYRINEKGLSCNCSTTSNDYINAFKEALKFVLDKKIKIKKMHRYIWDDKKEYKIFNIPIITVYKANNTKCIYLFKTKLMLLNSKELKQ